jgi:hypothetical protein
MLTARKRRRMPRYGLVAFVSWTKAKERQQRYCGNNLVPSCFLLV